MADGQQNGVARPGSTQRVKRSQTDPQAGSNLRLALDRCRAGRYVEAEQICRQDPVQLATPAGAIALATALLGQGRVREAASQAVRVLKEQPDFLPAHRILSKSLLLGGRPELALGVLDRATEKHPGDPWLERLRSEAEAACVAAAPVSDVDVATASPPDASAAASRPQISPASAEGEPADRPPPTLQLGLRSVPSLSSDPDPLPAPLPPTMELPILPGGAQHRVQQVDPDEAAQARMQAGPPAASLDTTPRQDEPAQQPGPFSRSPDQRLIDTAPESAHSQVVGGNPPEAVAEFPPTPPVRAAELASPERPLVLPPGPLLTAPPGRLLSLGEIPTALLHTQELSNPPPEAPLVPAPAIEQVAPAPLLSDSGPGGGAAWGLPPEREPSPAIPASSDAAAPVPAILADAGDRSYATVSEPRRLPPEAVSSLLPQSAARFVEESTIRTQESPLVEANSDRSVTGSDDIEYGDETSKLVIEEEVTSVNIVETRPEHLDSFDPATTTVEQSSHDGTTSVGPSPSDRLQPSPEISRLRPVTDWMVTAESNDRQRELIGQERERPESEPALEVVKPELPVVPTDEPRPKMEGVPRYALGGRPSTLRLSSGDLEIVSSIRSRLQLLSLEDSLQRAEAILDSLEDAAFPDSVVFSDARTNAAIAEKPPALLSSALAETEVEPEPPSLASADPEPASPAKQSPPGADPAGTTLPRSIPRDLAEMLSDESGYEPLVPPGPIPLAGPFASPSLPPGHALPPDQTGGALAAAGGVAVPLRAPGGVEERHPAQHQTRGTLGPREGGRTSQARAPAGLFSRRLDHPVREHSGLYRLQEMWSRTETGRRLASVTSRFRRPSLVLGIALPVLLLLCSWIGFVLYHHWRVGRWLSAISAAQRAYELGAYSAALQAERTLEELEAQSVGLGDSLAPLADWTTGQPSLTLLQASARDELYVLQATLVAFFGLTRALPILEPPGASATPRHLLALAVIRLAQHEPLGVLEIATDDRVRQAEGAQLLRIRTEALARLGQDREALALLETLPVETWRSRDHLLAARLLEERSPDRARGHYLRAFELSGCLMAQVLRIRLEQKSRPLAEAERLLLEQILENAKGASPRERAQAAAALAQQERAAGHDTGARTLLRRAIQLDPSELSFRLQGARMDLEQKELPRARQLLDEALASHPRCGDCRLLLAEIHRARGDGAGMVQALASHTPPGARTSYLRGHGLFLLERYQEASDQLVAALTLERDQFEATALLGVIRIILGNRKGGLELLHSLGRSQPDRSQLPLFLAVAWRLQGAYDQARNALAEAIRLDPQSHEAYAELCRVEFLAAFGGPARAACLRGLSLNPHFLPARRLLARIQEEEGNIAEAETAYREVVRQLPEDREALSGLISCALRQERDDEAGRLLKQHAETLGPVGLLLQALFEERAGRMDDAIRLLKSASTHASLASRAYTELGRMYLASGQDSQAFHVLRKATQGDAGDPGAFLLLGDLALKVDRPDDAIQHYQNSLILLDRRIHRVEDEAAALYGLGEAYFRKGPGFRRHSQDAFERAARADPRDGSSRLRQGELAEAEGNLRQALRMYREALRVDPHLVRVYWVLGRLLNQLGEQAEARRMLEEYVKRMPSGGEVQGARALLEKLGQ